MRGQTISERVNSAFDLIRISWWGRHSVAPWFRKAWKKKLPGEVEFWDNWLRDRNNPSLAFRLDPDSRIQDWLEGYLNRRLQVNRILDVGSGPLSSIGKRCEFSKIELKCCDVLADHYRLLLEKHGIVPPCEVTRAEAENLSSVFGENEFDLVVSNNAIDHTYDALKTVREMLQVTKKNGYVVIQVAENEGRRNLYRGLHQWDFYLRDKKFMIKRRFIREVDIGRALWPAAEIVEASYTFTNPAGMPWDHRHLRVALKKKDT